METTMNATPVTAQENDRIKEETIRFVQETFQTVFGDIQQQIHANAVAKGFYNNPPREGEAMALIHTEVAEATEGARHGNPPSEHIPEFSAVEEELADTVIRCMDWSEHKKYRLAEAIVAKMAYNAGRPHMHGGKRF